MPKAKSKSNSQGTISKFFRFKPPAKPANLHRSDSTEPADDSNAFKGNGTTKMVETIDYSQKRANHDSVDQTTKRQKLNPADEEQNSQNTQTATISLSDGTKQKLSNFLLEVNGEKPSDEITIAELKRLEADHITVDYNNTRQNESLSQNDTEEDSITNEGSSENTPLQASSVINNKLSKFAASKSGIKVKPKYTPLEQQFVELKEKYPDAILFVECGYKYRFFGEDAEVAAKELNIFAHLDHSFMTASIPVHRLYVHVRRLVSKGYKVGVVKQTETAALKAAGDNRNAPFTRRLSALYTKTTLIGEDVDPVNSEGGELASSQTSRAHLMCIYEPDLTSRNKSHQVAFVSVQPGTGELVYDMFTDLPTRTQLEMRVAHVGPVELLLPKSLTPATEKVIRQLTAFSCRTEDRLRIERLDDSEFEPVKAYNGIREFYGENSALTPTLQLPKPVLSCLHALLTYLKDFNLQNVLKLSSNLRQFTTLADHMLLPASTVRNLELFANLTDGQSRGSLFWVLNQTVSRFGGRLLRSWIARPLLSVTCIETRLGAVTELLANTSPVVTNLRELLTRLPDVEKGLCTIYHKRCSTQEFLLVCRALLGVREKVLPYQHSMTSQVESELLRDLLSDLPDLLDGVGDWVSAISEEAAKDGDKTRLFTDVGCYPEVVQCKADIESVLSDLENHRREIAKQLGLLSFSYKTIMGTEFLIDVKNSDVKRVPRDWIKISGTKASSRFHSPSIISSYKKLSQLREKLVIVCTRAWSQFLGSFEEVYPRYKEAVQHLATLDCLLSLAIVAKQDGFCRPELATGTSSKVHIESGRHPVVDVLLGEQDQYVPNDTHLEADGRRCRVITGPNMGGKSSYIKQVALLTIMAQVGCYLPAEAATIGVVDAVFTRMGASDELFAGRSTFMVELQEASEVMAQATSHSLVILDELGRGTSTHDGVAIAYATLKYFIEEVKCMTLFVTHYPPLGEIELLYPDHVNNHHMSFLIHEENEDEKVDNIGTDAITFLYQLADGAAGRSYGLNVARLAGVPSHVIQTASIKSRMLEDMVSKTKSDRELFVKLWSAEAEDVSRLVKDSNTS